MVITPRYNGTAVAQHLSTPGLRFYTILGTQPSILAAAVYEGDTVIVRDQYDGDEYFRMPAIYFD
jgi:hypothetical protein